MAQYDFGTIDPNTKSGTALASDLNSWRNAVHSTHSASSAPSYLVAGMLWADTTSANYELKMYDGAQWITVAILDATNNVARVAVDPAETSYITSTTSGQIRHLIASADVFTVRSTGVQFNIASPVIADSNNNELISFTTTASAVNQIGIANAATGGAATISAVGGDTNISLALTPKGTGGVGIGATSISYPLDVASASNATIRLTRTASHNVTLNAVSGGSFTIGLDGSGGTTERMRIDASGNVGIGTSVPSDYNAAADNLVVGTTSGNNGITIASGSASQGSLFFADGTATGAEEAAGYLLYEHTSNYMALGTINIERLRIASAGQIGIGGANYGTSGQVLTSGGSGAAPSWASADTYALLGTINTTSGTSQTLSGLTLTSYTALFLEFRNVIPSSSLTNYNLRLDSTTGTQISGNYIGVGGWYGGVTIMLGAGIFTSSLGSSNTLVAAVNPLAGDTTLSTASTSITIALSNNSFTSGSILVYGVK